MPVRLYTRMLSSMPQRHIEFERCFNFRDLGGYATADGHRVRWGRLFRGMTPEYMTEADVTLAREQLSIRKVIDLRRPTEPGMDSGPLGKAPNSRALIEFADVRAHPELRTLPPEEVLAHGLQFNATRIIEAIEFLIDGEGATLFHCHTGKDRTGLLTVVLLKLLGVSDEDVVEDYLHSVAGLETMLEHGLPLFAPDAPEFARLPPAESWVRALLIALEKYGGAEAYLKAAGASDGLLARFRESLIESV
jgi:protein-tyrosine phosphatase